MNTRPEPIEELHAENRRLLGELEQARTAAENTQTDIDAAAAELTSLRQQAHAHDALRQSTERVLQTLRGELQETTASLAAMQTGAGDRRGAEEELRVVVEELQVLAEELEDSNDALRLSNVELERRVDARTADLAAANAALAEHNRTLEQRIAEEVAAREAVQAARFHQQKLEALGQLTGGVAHDFNNLLTVVLSAVHLLGRADTDERRERLLGRIGEAAQRGASLTHRLLAFGRRQALRPVPLDLRAGLAELGELLAHSLRGDLRIQTQAPPDLWPIRVDHGALELALLNLAVNSRDAMPQGGSITLAANNRRVRTADAAAMEVAPGRYVEIALTDSGAGMSPEVLARVFEPYFTTKPVGQGSGLGLAQVYGFARQSGGTTRVASEPGAGCTVTLLLPAAEVGAAEVGAAEVGTAEVGIALEGAGGAGSVQPAIDAAAPASVLLVEDDQEVASLVSEMLAQFGHQVTRVATTEAALGALANGRQVDLLFTDVLLAGCRSGLELAHEAERRRPGLPILLTSGYGGDTIGGLQTVPWPLLRKPYQAEQLRDAVAAALGHG